MGHDRGMTEPLLHVIDTAGWQAARAAGVLAPPSLSEVGFVHLSTAAQVALPANQLFAGRPDLLLLVLDPGLIGVEVRWEPGEHGDPAAMRFPHAYGPVPTAAVVDVLDYRPGSDGRFATPTIAINLR
jgi:uncharacterized protein (DUF952 family)